jgi:hypothetical protein
MKRAYIVMLGAGILGALVLGLLLYSPSLLHPRAAHVDLVLEGAEQGGVGSAADVVVRERDRTSADHKETASKAPQANEDGLLLVTVTDAGGKACAGASVFVVRYDFPNAALLGLSPYAIQSQTTRDLLVQFADRYIADSLGQCHVKRLHDAGSIRAFGDAGEGRLELNADEFAYRHAVSLAVAKRHATLIQINDDSGAPVHGGSAGVIVHYHSGEERLFLLRALTNRDGVMEVGLSSVLEQLQRSDDQIVDLGLCVYRPGCTSRGIFVDANALADKYSLIVPPVAQLNISVFRSGRAVKVNQVMIREKPTRPLFPSSVGPWQEPWFPMAEGIIDAQTVYSVGVAAGGLQYEVNIMHGDTGNRELHDVAGPIAAKSAASILLPILDSGILVSGRIVEGQAGVALPIEWSAELRPHWTLNRAPSARSMVGNPLTVGADGSFSVILPAASRQRDGAVIPGELERAYVDLWSADRNWLATMVVPLGSIGMHNDVYDVGDVVAHRSQVVASIQLVEGAGGGVVLGGAIDADAECVGADGMMRTAKLRLTQQGTYEVLGPEAVTLVRFGCGGDRYVYNVAEFQPGKMFRVPLELAGCLELDWNGETLPASIVLRGADGTRTVGNRDGRCIRWWGLRPGSYELEVADQNGTRSLGSQYVVAGQTAKMQGQ